MTARNKNKMWRRLALGPALRPALGIVSSFVGVAALVGMVAGDVLSPPAWSAELEKSAIEGSAPAGVSVFNLDNSAVRRLELAFGRARLVRVPVRVREVIVANPDIVDVVVKSPQLLYLLGKRLGGTNIVLLDDNGREIFDLDITIFRDISDLRRNIANVFGEQNIDVSAIGNAIVLSGTVRSTRIAEDVRRMAARFAGGDQNVINQLNITQSQQVSLHVRVAEVSRRVMKELNFNGSFAFGGARPNGGAVDEFFNRVGLNAPVTGGGGGFGRNVSGDPAIAGRVGISFFSRSFLGGTNLLLDALEGDGLIKTLAEPNLTAMSGEEASFLAGGEIPVPTGVDNLGRIRIEFKEFGVALRFRPVVLDDGRIKLTVFTEVSQIDPTVGITLSNLSIPGFKTRRAETTVELPSGGSLIIGGLLENNMQNVIEGFPGLRNIPILGALFRSVKFEQAETELVIAVTPYLVRPMNDRDIVLPTDGLAPPGDLDMYLFGRLHARYGRGGEGLPKGRPVGPLGYEMD